MDTAIVHHAVFRYILVLAQTTFVNRSRATFGLNVPLGMPRISSAGGRERQPDAISAAAKPRCSPPSPESYKRSRVITLKRSKDRDAPQKADKSTLGVGCRRPSRQTRCPLIPLVKPEPQCHRKDTHLSARNTAELSSWISSIASPLCSALAFCNFEFVARDIWTRQSRHNINLPHQGPITHKMNPGDSLSREPERVIGALR